MLSRFLSLSGLILALCLLQGCSTPESQERLDTVLCWLRPSCLPSQPSDHKIPATPAATKRSSTPPKRKPPPKVSSQTRPATKCLTSAEATIQASKPFVTVSYVEPTTKAHGEALTNLAKTTIYHDLGKGLVKYKDIPATSPEGGGKIQEKISFTVKTGTSIQVTICVTATNTNGQEG
jgi:hypothetical protein